MKCPAQHTPPLTSAQYPIPDKSQDEVGRGEELEEMSCVMNPPLHGFLRFWSPAARLPERVEAPRLELPSRCSAGWLRPLCTPKMRNTNVMPRFLKLDPARLPPRHLKMFVEGGRCSWDAQGHVHANTAGEAQGGQGRVGKGETAGSDHRMLDIQSQPGCREGSALGLLWSYLSARPKGTNPMHRGPPAT